ncbi:nuclear transport factor 2 family protein [Actinomycetospora lemnae]|uniref:Nuclear transport factor 2 family protein n=1 Tax=Actinomycetospora lemnae TaxID=3019891 RepID=A0ABT5T563_9PSEU|nr:nuclear transport factor 2 family protein [Actinomycetospora sp. DW7H6]MDD7969063.1 nuclear transport factor 2 family protein [Actinomycetospora sp. DW7H6]
MSEVEEFLGEMLPRQLAADRALCRGDASGRAGTWSRRDPVTLFGAAARVRRGRDAVDAVARWLASRFTDVRAFDLELVAAGASGDLAYTVGFEHKTVVVDGAPATYTLRVTHVYRREDGEWRIVHRHGDHPPTNDRAPDAPAAAVPTAG